MFSAYLPACMVTLILSRQDSNSVPSLLDPRHRGAGSLLFTFMYFRSRTRKRFPLQFDLIVVNGGTDEIF